RGGRDGRGPGRAPPDAGRGLHGAHRAPGRADERHEHRGGSLTMTATTPTAIAVPESPDTMLSRLRWLAADTWTLTLRGINHWIRQPLTIIGGLGFMIMLVALYGFLFGGAMRVPG